MDRPSQTPPATARPRNSSSSISSTHAASTSQQPANMAASPRAARGGTPTASRSASKLADADKPTRAASKDSLKQKMLKKPEEVPQPSSPDEQLTALKADFSDLRSHLTCKICDRLLYQPYTISCGHTYCYTCLCTWFVNNKTRKTCPDCRILVKELPAPAYVIRDMTGVFINRAELIPPGETMEEHLKWQQEEADAVQLDKDNADPRTGGLFKGSFKALQHPRPSLHVMRDEEDGVDRCPVCTWELEDGGCTQCGLIFDESGELSWGDSFTGFSDMDDMSEQDPELDAEMEMEDGDFEGFEDPMENWQDYLPHGSFVMRRFLGAGVRPTSAHLHRRPLTHSEAGSRRSYSQSIVSDMQGDEMDTVEEEDEEEEDEEDSSMNDFIDDDENASTSADSSTPAPTPQPSNSRPRAQARARRVVESETSSNISSVVEEDDEEDEGPVPRGQRNHFQARVLNRANGSRSSHGPSSSTSTDASAEELDEDTQALLREEGWMLQHDDDEMGEDDGNDSDGGRTTVGWEPLAISNDRVRMGGSLTPTADRPRPSAPIRPPSRAGARIVNASRGLRRRSSVIAPPTAPYEDGEADDDDSDQDGDVAMAMNSLRTRRSQLQLRNQVAFANPPSRFANHRFAQGGTANEGEFEEHSDNSQPGVGRRIPRTIRREYDPRISIMFAAHQQALQEHHTAGALIDVEPRSITPLTRPRTSNRNRPSPAQTYSPFRPPSRLRTPLMEDALNFGVVSRMPMSPPRRSAMSPAFPTAVNMANHMRNDRAPSLGSASDASGIMTPGTSTPGSQHSINTIAQSHTAAILDMMDRPQSRVGARPPSAAGRRNSANFSPVYGNVGMHVQGSGLPPFPAAGNPWAAYVQAQSQSRGLRNRSSRQVLREQSSTATIRPTSSRVNLRDINLRDVVNPQQGMRPQASRINLRPQPSRRQLSNQASTRTLRASEHARPPQSPGPNVQGVTQPVNRPIRLTQDERNSRAQELIETRMRALGQPGNAPARTNPFTPGFRRPVGPAENPAMAHVTMTSNHARSNSNDSMHSVNSSGTTQGAPSSPALGRRRSNRNMSNGPPPGALPQPQGPFVAPVTAYPNGYYRPRQGSLNSPNQVYESPLDANTRVLNPMMAGPLI
ncbi:hypothetical protein P153DRAFT_306909 [Dothidotthia symphoricarpi CBS 119687]|uniref:RING-type domain-containing protein n=1 Tax=Dothidotthia symphoricarpi CBS 119687 TaxID=1392245 RepID=A0A6A6AU46_9PLEO|nr:uncharacterized protein P153DRAFT_306909 [Dothidotthia symphoricarpi CBS 119687]KAF2134071.1 hypothetical protein P153DRAFT_306909 [Dothidotthia symphoricarpi CBS 119687]